MQWYIAYCKIHFHAWHCFPLNMRLYSNTSLLLSLSIARLCVRHLFLCSVLLFLLLFHCIFFLYATSSFYLIIIISRLSNSQAFVFFFGNFCFYQKVQFTVIEKKIKLKRNVFICCLACIFDDKTGQTSLSVVHTLLSKKIHWTKNRERKKKGWVSWLSAVIAVISRKLLLQFSGKKGSKIKKKTRDEQQQQQTIVAYFWMCSQTDFEITKNNKSFIYNIDRKEIAIETRWSTFKTMNLSLWIESKFECCHAMFKCQTTISISS